VVVVEEEEATLLGCTKHGDAATAAAAEPHVVRSWIGLFIFTADATFKIQQ
jgi:hypothetical protein